MASERGTAGPLRILFSMRNTWYIRLFESVIRECARRGHRVHILAEQERAEVGRDWNAAAEALAAEYPGITFAWAPRQIDNDWIDLRLMIRLGIDHLRFQTDAYAHAPALVERARRRTPEAIVALADRPGWRTRPGRAAIAAALRLAEHAMPTDGSLAACIAEWKPDLMLITPLLTLGSEQQDVLRIGRRLGIPTALCVGSWDHLSSKALIRERPDRVLVWNETQKDEATTLHQIPASRVVVTGAQCFDQWFDRTPTLSRDEFCRKVGLDPSRPYVLYVCSALFEGSPSEAEFVVRWAEAVRASGDATLSSAGLLVRPHPKRGFEWDAVDATVPGMVLWPPRGAAPLDGPTKADYFDSMYHAAAVVGLNTSALIESGIVGRAVHTILLPEFYENQEGTLHFHYLLRGGLLRVTRDLAAHVAELAASVAQADPAVHHNRAFVEAFVRPRGLDVPATPGFVDAVESLARAGVAPTAEPWWVPRLRRALEPLAKRTSGTFAEQIARERRRRIEERERAERIERHEAMRAEQRSQRLAAREAQKQAKARAEQARREQVLQERAARRQARADEHERARADKLEAKQRARVEKERQERAAKSQRRRRRRIAAFGVRLRRLLGSPPARS